MMTMFVDVDDAGVITALYCDAPGYATPPDTAVPVTDAQGETLRAGFSNWLLVNGELVPNNAFIFGRVRSEFLSAVQRHLDTTVQARGYDSAMSCASYAASTNPIFAAEAAAAIAWRDAVWAYCYSELEKVLAGQRAVPSTHAEFLGELPVLVW